MRSLRSGILFVVLAVWLAVAGAVDGDRFFDQGLGDFPAELDAARKSGKLGVLLMFEAESCPYCRKMRQQVLSRGDVQAYFRKRFAIFSVDAFGDVPITDFAGRETTEKAYARALKIRGTPSFIVFGLDGRELARLSGAAKDAEEFLLFGRYVGDGHYKEQTMDQYLAAARGRK